jgi:hypothetical protein
MSAPTINPTPLVHAVQVYESAQFVRTLAGWWFTNPASTGTDDVNMWNRDGFGAGVALDLGIRYFVSIKFPIPCHNDFLPTGNPVDVDGVPHTPVTGPPDTYPVSCPAACFLGPVALCSDANYLYVVDVNVTFHR